MKARRLTETQRRVLRALARWESVAEVELEAMDGPWSIRAINTERCLAALERRGLVGRDEYGCQVVTDAGLAAIANGSTNG